MTEISDWIYRISRYRLLGSRCVKCGEVTYPPRLKCFKCGSEMMDYQLPRRGKIIHYTSVKNLPERYNRFGAYYIAIIELDDGTRIFGLLTDIEKPEVGIRVEACLRKLYTYGEEGKIIYGLKFRPVID
ncbi:TPA: Zn-ribbon domain-containing OB-fold protein [Candidatus Geothermarchaeota archaeon]|nr:Zn-ribbon domain-containing OB-fold protein [Candidatus Geothermarchaeota archaeon]